MADGHLTRTAEVIADHAYHGGYDLSDVYGKKKPSATSSSGGADLSAVEDTADGPYAGPQYTSPYAKPAVKPTNTAEDYTESRPPVASSGYGKYDTYGESRPSGYAEGQYSSHPTYGRKPDSGVPAAASGYGAEGQHSSQPGYGRRPDSGVPAAASGYGTYDKYGESPQSGYVEEGQYSSQAGYEGRPHSRPPVASPAHVKHDNYGETRPSEYSEEGQYSSHPGYEGRPHSRPPVASSGHVKHDNYGESRPSEYVEGGQYSSRPGYAGESEIPEGRFAGVPDQGYGRKPTYGDEYETGRKPTYGGEYETEGTYPPSVGSGGRRPAAPYVKQEEEVPSWPSAPPQSQYWSTNQESEYSEGRIPGPRKPGWQQDPEIPGYGGLGGGGARPHHVRPESGFTEYEAPRPTYESHQGGHQGAGGYGSIPYKHENPCEQEEHHKVRPERFGRQDDDDRLAYETAGLSLGSGGYPGRDEGYRTKRDDSDSDDETKKHNKHHEKHEKHGHHHQKHRDDYD